MTFREILNTFAIVWLACFALAGFGTLAIQAYCRWAKRRNDERRVAHADEFQTHRIQQRQEAYRRSTEERADAVREYAETHEFPVPGQEL